MKKKHFLTLLLSLILIIPGFMVKAEEEINLAAVAYQCIKCGSHQVQWYKKYYTNWKDYAPNGNCPDGKNGYVHIIQRKYYFKYLSCSACGADFKDGETGYDTREICRKGG